MTGVISRPITWMMSTVLEMRAGSVTVVIVELGSMTVPVMKWQELFAPVSLDTKPIRMSLSPCTPILHCVYVYPVNIACFCLLQHSL